MAEITRLLRCDSCRTVESLPDYAGPPEQDHLLEALIVRNHIDADGQRHIGKLLRVETRHWDSPSTREEIIRRLREESGHTGLDPDFYATKDTFSEDALLCFQEHHRNPKCSDYKSDRKRLTPGTSAERKAAGLPAYRSPHDRYLCEFCPVHTLVVEAARHKAGMYK